MQFGPFNKQDLPRIEPVLKELGIAYTVTEDQELLKALSEEFQKRDNWMTGKGPTFQPAYIHIDFEEAELPKVGDRLEQYGITLQTPFEPDFDIDDYFCPTCGTHSVEPGVCKTHNVPLIQSEEYKKLQRAEEEKGMRSTWRVVTVFIAAAVGYWLVRLFL